MPTFSFTSPATETITGTAYFSVEAETEDEARALLAEDSALYLDDFSESDSGTEWDEKLPKDWKLA
jgi:hypothetical protein